MQFRLKLVIFEKKKTITSFAIKFIQITRTVSTVKLLWLKPCVQQLRSQCESITYFSVNFIYHIFSYVSGLKFSPSGSLLISALAFRNNFVFSCCSNKLRIVRVQSLNKSAGNYLEPDVWFLIPSWIRNVSDKTIKL